MVQGYYADDGMRNLTAAATGTTYQSDNPSVATVDANGELTAQGNGTVTITATNGTLHANVTVRVESETDLAISQTDNPDPIGVDGRVTYTLTVQNQGTQPALDVEVYDTLPAGAALLQWTGAGWSCIKAGGVVMCRRDVLNTGASTALTLTVQATLPCGAIVNRASVKASIHDPNAEDDVSSSASTCPSTYYPLTASKTGDGFGAVISYPAGIDCGLDCEEAYPGGAAVILTAAPARGSGFSGWSGACAGTGFCTVTMDAAKAVTAAFTVLNPDDLDGDGILNALDPDGDGDGMTDAWEQAHGLDSLNPLDAALDPDGDGMSNLREYQTGADPQVADSYQTACPGVNVMLLDRVYLASASTCTASQSIRAGLPVTLSTGAEVTYIAPKIFLLSGFQVQVGGRLRVGPP